MFTKDQWLDPRWQKKRLEIMDRDNWECVDCGRNEETLNVHHLLYFDDIENPWEYENGHLLTLCKDCHKDAHECRMYIPTEMYDFITSDFFKYNYYKLNFDRFMDLEKDRNVRKLFGNWGPFV